MHMKSLLLTIALFFISLFGFGQNLSVKIENIDVEEGYFFVAVFDSQESFDKRETPHRKKIHAKDIKKPIVFNGLKPGEYAVSVFYDTNNNKQLDMKKSGIPDEPYGLSNNPGLGTPKFDKISFRFDKDHQVIIQMRTVRNRN